MCTAGTPGHGSADIVIRSVARNLAVLCKQALGKLVEFVADVLQNVRNPVHDRPRRPTIAALFLSGIDSQPLQSP